ncbi:MAG TPA: SH3 domain-containing protein, partial [Aggregatilineales bacterium]|nr:SH3 domain-containing protein [Aggregatilineales bacterium]
QPSAGSSPTLAPVGNPQIQSSGAQSTAIGQGDQGGPGSGLNPAALSVGAQATVTVVSGGTLNMHPSPSATAPIVHTLNPGDKVIVLSPPQLAEGFRWWLVRAPDNSQGWAVDQIGSTVTLTLVSVIDTGNCLGHVGGTLHVGGTAMAKDHESLFNTPGPVTTENTVASVKACDKLDIVGGPQVINGINWWQVRTVSGTVGWAFERPLYAPGGPFLIIPID